MVSKSIEKIIGELVILGLTERKILNRLKDIKNDLITEDVECFEDNKKFNKLINGLMFGGKFYINNPSQPLLGLIKTVKKLYGSEFTYYLLYNILTKDYFNNQIHDKSEYEKCNWLMYLIKTNTEKCFEDFKNINKACKEPF